MDKLLFVPVRVNAHGGAFTAVRTARPGAGQERVGLAFTGPEALRAALGNTQHWIRLSRPALAALLAPLGINDIRIDPLYIGPQLPAAPPPDLLETGPVLAGVWRHPQWLPDEVW
ncbi:SAV_915 family protein [Streptomyces sp. NPDC052236]|uniref:SAV_915 family protein n=1 Tax=Streptomyces sp. NPDC052236 TaxID=3365686 RepID=UPI0037D4B537